jgi:type VI secretion system FHA domain protein
MILTLTILRCPPNVAPEMRRVTGGEFAIGRGTESDWVLPDPEKHLSKRHCLVAFRNGQWQIAGTSTNGTFLNGEDVPLESRPPRTLEDRDRLRFGAYEIEVRLEPAETQNAWDASGRNQKEKSDPFGNDPFGHAPLPTVRSDQIAPPAPDAFQSQLPMDFDPLAPSGAGDEFRAPTWSDHTPAVSDAVHLPQRMDGLPDDWDVDESGAKRARATPSRVRLDRVAPAAVTVPRAIVQSAIADAAPPPAEVPSVARPREEEVDAVPKPAISAPDALGAFLRGAGMPDARPADSQHAMEQIGAAFRALVSGVRRALIARSGIKREFRIEATEIRARGNNLLKFSANDDDALAGLLGAGRRTDMTPEEAVADALADIRLHELATIAAMQSAVRSLVARLGPEQIWKTTETGGGIAWPGARKARGWDAYKEIHDKVSEGLSDDFDSVFGKSFARAYEQAMQELTARQKPDRGEQP